MNVIRCNEVTIFDLRPGDVFERAKSNVTGELYIVTEEYNKAEGVKLCVELHDGRLKRFANTERVIRLADASIHAYKTL